MKLFYGIKMFFVSLDQFMIGTCAENSNLVLYAKLSSLVRYFAYLLILATNFDQVHLY